MPLVLHGCSAQVLCDGQELEQFDVRQEDDHTISCWIASEEGQEFTVHCTYASADDNTSIRLYMDGRLTNRQGHQAGKGGYSTLEGMIAGPGLIRPFKFAPLVLTDDDNVVAFKGIDEKLGTIQLDMHHVDHYIVNRRDTGVVLEVDDIGPVHEKSKKAGVHAVSLGNEIAKATGIGTLTPVGFEEEPFAKFIFRYRPLGLLQANGLAPRPPTSSISKKRSSDVHERPNTPKQSQSKRQRTVQEPDVKPEPDSESEGEGDDEDDVTFLEEQLVMLQKRLAEKKGKKKAKAIVKREPSPIRVPTIGTNEVIDLT